MYQWKKLLSQGKLIKEVIIEGRHVSIILQDEHNNPAYYYSINNMFYNLWKSIPQFNQTFERITLQDCLPFLMLTDENHFVNAQDVLNALMRFGNHKQKRLKQRVAPVNEKESEADEEGVKSPKLTILKPTNKRGDVHRWKKLLSKGKLIEYLDIKDSRVFVQLVEEYNKKPLFRGVNVMLQKLYDKSSDLQKTYQRPTVHTSCPYLILLSQKVNHDPAKLLNILINSAKHDKIKFTKNINTPSTVSDRVKPAIEEPSKPIQPEVKLDEIYDIFNDLLSEPIVEPEQLDFPLTDIESERPFFGFEHLLPKKIPDLNTDGIKQLPVANDPQKVPILRFKYTKK